MQKNSKNFHKKTKNFLFNIDKLFGICYNSSTKFFQEAIYMKKVKTFLVAMLAMLTMFVCFVGCGPMGT